MKRILLFVLALLCHGTTLNAQCPSNEGITQGIHDIFLSVGWAGLTKSTIELSREYVLHDAIDLQIPSIPTSIIYTDPDDDGSDQVFTPRISIKLNESAPVMVTSNGVFSASNLKEGKNVLSVIIILTTPCHHTFFGFLFV